MLKSNQGFTLLELIIVVGIIAVLGTVSVLVINPAELMKQARDSIRISDSGTIGKAISVYQDLGNTNLGTTLIDYISIPDTSSTCANLGLPALGGGWTYHCSTAANYQKVDGTGWIPINFTGLSISPPLEKLPKDPVNTVAGSLYYQYMVGTWKFTIPIESQKYLAQAQNDGGTSATQYEVGSDLALTPVGIVPNGQSQANAGKSCYSIMTGGYSTGNGIYWIDPDGGSTANAYQIWCDMVTDGGGWTYVVGIDSANWNQINNAAVTPGNLTSSSGLGKLSDADINLIKSGVSPAFRFTCGGTETGYFKTTCTFNATTDASGDCVNMSTVFSPASYIGSTVQAMVVGLADGNHGTNDRLIYGYSSPIAGCDNTAGGWNHAGNVYVR